MRATLRLFATSLIGLFLINAAAQAASITGRVRDANNQTYMLGAAVSIKELDRTTTTQSDGSYNFANVPPGNYTLTTSYIGYSDKTASVQVGDGSDARADFSMGDEILHLGKFTVSGEREGQARALQQKRIADNLMEIVSADSAGKLPDGNAAEAVRRLPGVFAEIDQNEGRYIVVRGIDASLNNITINGVNVGSTESGSRGAGMDSVPADLISRIEVVKAVTPDMDHQAIGASVNIVTPSAFDRSEPFAYGTVAGGKFNGPGDDMPYSGSATYGRQFGGGKWGFVVGGSYSYRHYISERRSGGNPWSPAGPAGTPGADIFFPANEAVFLYDVQRWRQGVNLALEFKPSDRNYFAFRAIDNRFKDEEGRQQNNFEFWRTATPASFTATTATFTGGRASVEYRYYLQEHNITSYSFEGKHTLGSSGATTLSYNVALGNAEKQTPDRQDWEFRSGTNISSTLDTAPEYWTLAKSANFYDAASYPFRRVRFRSDAEEEDNLTAKVDLKREQQFFGHAGYWQIGGKYFSRDKSWDRENVNWLAGTGANLFNLSQFDLSVPGPVLFDGTRTMSPQINLAKAQAFFAANPNYFVANTAAQIVDSTGTDFNIDEDILATYAMARVNFRWGTMLAGVRFERSEGTVTGTEFPTVGGVFLGPRKFTESNSYNNVLPGVHFRLEPAKNWVVRFSWTNTVGRPNYPDLAASRSFSYSEDVIGSGVYLGSISEGNPALQPYESMNFDFTVERYLKNAGIISAGVFHKEVDNPVFTNAYTQRNVTYEGLNFRTLDFSRPENAESGTVTGLELNYQQQLTMLPAPLDGLGFSVNYMLANSEEKLFSRPTEDLPFAKQAESIYNVALFYEKYRWQARLGYTYTGDFIKSFGANINSDQYQAERKIIDVKVSYRLTKNFTLFADVINLGEEPLDEYAGFPNRNQATERYWWTANFGVNWRL